MRKLNTGSTSIALIGVIVVLVVLFVGSTVFWVQNIFMTSQKDATSTEEQKKETLDVEVDSSKPTISQEEQSKKTQEVAVDLSEATVNQEEQGIQESKTIETTVQKEPRQEDNVFEDKENKVSGKCTTIAYNGFPTDKINLYFYENGLNENMQKYDEFVSESIAIIFGGSSGEKVYPGVEPFKSLERKFNIFTYQDKENDCYFPVGCSLANRVYPDLSVCQGGFAAPSDWGELDGNYNIIVIATSDWSGQASGSSSLNRLDSKTLRVTSADIIYVNVNSANDSTLLHELGHRIGFLDEEYSFFDLYLGARTFSPNVDSFSCTKWCQGVDVQSACYGKYTSWLDCFTNRVVEKSTEVQDILQKSGVGYSSDDYNWWSACFETRNIQLCGDMLFAFITPHIGGTGEEWVSDWDYCKAQYLEAPGQNSCDLGLNCSQGAGCYVGESFSRFLPSQENQFIMGNDTRTNDKFNAYDEEILRHNILNKIRYVDVEVTER